MTLFWICSQLCCCKLWHNSGSIERFFKRKQKNKSKQQQTTKQNNPQQQEEKNKTKESLSLCFCLNSNTLPIIKKEKKSKTKPQANKNPQTIKMLEKYMEFEIIDIFLLLCRTFCKANLPVVLLYLLIHMLASLVINFFGNKKCSPSSLYLYCILAYQ